MVEAAKKAGFPNVKGIDEAQAAIHAAVIQNEDALSKKNYLVNGRSVNIMLIDMGAGTTDIVICRHTPGEEAKTEVLCTWPREGNVFFGGREVDQLLMDYMGSLLPAEVATLVLKRCGRDKFKAWKDHTLSPALTRRETVTEFYDFDFVAGLVCDEVPEYAIDRATLEEYAKAYLQKLPKLVQGSLEDANLQGKDIDLVILAGGHSQWYFVKEILTDALSACGVCGLRKIREDTDRVIQISLPQETVALGLVYGKLSRDTTPPEPPEPPEPGVSYGDLVEEFITKIQPPPYTNCISQLSDFQLRQTREQVGIADNERILYTVKTLFFSPTSVFYFTTQHIIWPTYSWLDLQDGYMNITWEEFSQAEICAKRGRLRVNNCKVNAVYPNNANQNNLDRWRYFYLDLQKYLQDNAHRVQK